MGNSCIIFKRKLKPKPEEPIDPETLRLRTYHTNFPPQNAYYNPIERSDIERELAFELAHPSEPRIATKIKCSEDAIIGKGSYGEVSRGYDSANKLFMAVKRVPRTQLPANDKGIEELFREIKLLSMLNHRNVVQYYGCKKLPRFLIIYMEYVDMGSLEDLVKQYGTVPEDVTAKYTEQILKGLDYLHSHSVIHRDIKTGNVLVDTKGVVKISDFGCAKVITSHAESFKGTVSYMAPEVR